MSHLIRLVLFLGVYTGDAENGGVNTPLMWSSPVSETPKAGKAEIWEIINLTEDIHPFHIHQIQFQILNRYANYDPNQAYAPPPWETGFKDTLLSYPQEITRVLLNFDIPGHFVWHCHLLEHEDNELMRPILVSA